MGGGASSLYSSVADKIRFPCASFADGDHPSRQTPSTILNSLAPGSLEIEGRGQVKENSNLSAKNLCTICLEPLGISADRREISEIFTANCSHSFHLVCIASNVRHAVHFSDPILRILDDSIATSRVNRRSSLRLARYDDDDPTDPHAFSSILCHHRLHLSLSQPFVGPSLPASASLFVRLAPQPPTDLVLVATPNGSHLRLLKQAIALAVFSLRPMDRLALVTCSPTVATRAFALRRMSSHGKRMALQVIDRLFHLGEAHPGEGIEKAFRILEDRTHRNPISCVLHLSDSPVPRAEEQQSPFKVHFFHVGFGFGGSSGFVMHEFEEFLARVLGGEVNDVQLRIGEERSVVRLEDLRCYEERRIPVEVPCNSKFVYISYSYKEGLHQERVVTGDAVVAYGEKGDNCSEDGDWNSRVCPRRRSCAERWDYLDPFMARRWAKHLHGCRT
ncbi:hypothetical protein HPP92_020470 [Vanilla planifolia]|uniref:RING-type domain-containing protein n=1 Tax=Vanilla planifolia TaxID=51239 RepID=A0A835Q593_VANPL|nr:hypothetical protein HPP92_020470 [Vanilla planifolia]